MRSTAVERFNVKYLRQSHCRTMPLSLIDLVHNLSPRRSVAKRIQVHQASVVHVAAEQRAEKSTLDRVSTPLFLIICDWDISICSMRLLSPMSILGILSFTSAPLYGLTGQRTRHTPSRSFNDRWVGLGYLCRVVEAISCTHNQ